MENKINVSIVNYLNSQPFIYGLEHHTIHQKINISKDIPSACALKLLNNEADIGLVPVAVIPQLKDFEIIGNTCIGALGKVASVLLCSDVPLDKIKNVFLDFHSRTSVTLVQVLSKNYWKIKPNFLQAPINFIDEINDTTAGVIIGDRTFNLLKNYQFIYDLSEEWYKFTGLPFVFAAWMGRKGIDSTFLNDFENALQFGLENKEIVIQKFQKIYGNDLDVAHYLNTNIQYELDEEKRSGMEMFLGLVG
ncbi:MAG TPA: menaquinone biosynthesis protein [Bacteroidia bacterium]|nr:menaquinone biosynthesis protein [Bacteroidia bacterium]